MGFGSQEIGLKRALDILKEIRSSKKNKISILDNDLMAEFTDWFLGISRKSQILKNCIKGRYL